MAEPWAPALDDVARHIPTRTRDTDDPGSDELLGTFTTRTTPTGDQVQPIIDAAVAGVLSRTGPLDASDAALLECARVAAEWRAAADVELAYPNRDADVFVYQQLDARAQYELTGLLRRLQATGEGFAEQLPVWSAPDPPVYADRDPGDYTRPIGPRYWGAVDYGPYGPV
jgi:hypothetical protein